MRYFSVVLVAGLAGALASFATSATVTYVGEVNLIIDTVRGVGLVVMAATLYWVLIRGLKACSSACGEPDALGAGLMTYYASAVAFIIGAILASTEVFTPSVAERLTTQVLGDTAFMSLIMVPLVARVAAFRNESVILLGAVVGGVRQYVGFAFGAMLKFVGLGAWVVTALHSWYPALALSANPLKCLPITDVAAAACVDGALIMLSLVVSARAFLGRCVGP